jgi:hypothetical protein
VARDIVEGVKREVKTPIVVQGLDNSWVLRPPSETTLHARVKRRAGDSSLNQLLQKACVQTNGILLSNAVDKSPNHELHAEEKLVAMINSV